MNTINIKTVRVDARLPKYATEGAAGADVHACLLEPVVIPSGKWHLIPTGLVADIPRDIEIQVRPRSGLANKFGVTVLNAPGTIDSDYRGEIMVMLINHGKNDFMVTHGDRIAQLVVAPAPQTAFVATGGSVSATARGAGGFGSTGA
jgi:dUTP pyrophosphatase